MRPDFIERMRHILDKHPAPWHIADNDRHGEGTTYAWICDANGKQVVGSSEWLDMDYDLMQFVVDVFNSTHIPPRD